MSNIGQPDIDWANDHGTETRPDPKPIRDPYIQQLEDEYQESLKRVDMVNHPSHYTKGEIEVIEFIEDQKLDFCDSQVVKYTCRAGHKDPNKVIEDYEKAEFYLKRKIENLKLEKEGKKRFTIQRHT